MAEFFEIGFGRTGTRSLHLAVTLLGMTTWTGGGKRGPARASRDDMFQKVFAGKFDWDAIGAYDYIGSVVMPFYAPLAKAYPESKFILTRRDERQWFVAQKCRAALNIPKQDAVLSHRAFLRMAMFGTVIFNREQWTQRYAQHNANVIRYFEDQPDRLLVLDVESTGEEKQQRLEEFTGRKWPGDQVWPWIRKGKHDLNNPVQRVA